MPSRNSSHTSVRTSARTPARSFAVIPPRPVTYTIGTEPVLSIVNILLLIGAVEDNYGLSSWIGRVERELTKQERETHVMLIHLAGEGFADVIEQYPEVRDDFPAFVHVLETADAVWLRDTLIYRMFHSLHLRVFADKEGGDTRHDIAELLSDAALFAKTLDADFEGDFDQPMIAHLFELCHQPEQFQAQIVAHLRMMWERFLAAEWARVHPALQDSAAQYEDVEISDLPPMEAVQAITGRDLRAVFSSEVLSRLERIVFVPAKHNGPYVSWFGSDTTLYVFFASRRAADQQETAVQGGFDTSALLDALNGLGDETRLRIMLALKANQQMTTQEIMQMFDLNKSAASRHLRQLFANGLIQERRDQDNKTKIYSLNPDRMQKLLHALEAAFLD